MSNRWPFLMSLLLTGCPSSLVADTEAQAVAIAALEAEVASLQAELAATRVDVADAADRLGAVEDQTATLDALTAEVEDAADRLDGVEADLDVWTPTLDALSVEGDGLHVHAPLLVEDVASFSDQVSFASAVTSPYGVRSGARNVNPSDLVVVELFTGLPTSTWLVSAGSRNYGGIHGAIWVVYFSESGCEVRPVEGDITALSCDGATRKVLWTRPGGDAYSDLSWVYIGQ